MATWFAFKLRLNCPECGESTHVDGPWQRLVCAHCGSSHSIKFVWPDVLERARDDGKPKFQPGYNLDTGRNIAGFQFSYAHGMAPECTCGAQLATDAVPDGHDGKFFCTACGEAHETFPAPEQLQKLRMKQVFLGVREEQQGVEPVAANARPVMFACASCGGALKITTETKRIVSCEFCDVDQFLPALLWNQLHPIRKRRAFWLRGA